MATQADLDREKFFSEPHYNGSPAVLVRLPAVTATGPAGPSRRGGRDRHGP